MQHSNNNIHLMSFYYLNKRTINLNKNIFEFFQQNSKKIAITLKFIYFFSKDVAILPSPDKGV